MWSHRFPHPAGPAGALVSDLLQGGTVGPLLSGVKALSQLYVSRVLNPAQETESGMTVYYNLQLQFYGGQVG